MEDIKEVKPKKKRPHPEGEVKKKRPRPEGEAKKKRPRPEGEVKKKRPRPEGEVKKKRPRPEGEVKKKRPRPEGEVKKKATRPEDVKAVGHRKPEKKKKKGAGHILGTIVLIIALGVFAFSAFQLYQIFHGYQEGQNEYDDVIALAIDGNDKDEDAFRVDFDELMKINSDTVGWIRFYPEPSQINYPVVQTTDNDLYLHKTFSANDNTVGAIFVNTYNHSDFNDKHTIVYGHRMNDNTMFHDLAKYADKDFWESNPYFYIYTPDGRKITYHIYAAGQILETSDSYLTEFVNDEEFQNFIYLSEQESKYATGVDVTVNDTVVTLSTCVKGEDEARFVVRGVKMTEELMDKAE